MTDIVFRTAVEKSSDSGELPKGENPSRSGDETKIEVPYFDYHKTHGKNFLAEHYQLGNTWRDSEGGFTEEVGTLEEYIKDKINSGEIANSQSAVKELLKGMEKMNNLSKEERPVVKLGVLRSYARFLMETDKIKFTRRG